jgi:hypothetical protein
MTQNNPPRKDRKKFEDATMKLRTEDAENTLLGKSSGLENPWVFPLAQIALYDCVKLCKICPQAVGREAKGHF